MPEHTQLYTHVLPYFHANANNGLRSSHRPPHTTPVARHHRVAERGSACFTQCTPVLPARSLRTGSTGRSAQAHTRSRTAWRSAMTSKASMEGILHNNIQRIHQDLIPQGHTRLNQHRELLIVVRRQRSAETSCRRTTKDLEVVQEDD